MTEISDVEQENLQNIVHRIASHIVKGSAAILELKATIAKLKGHSSDLECVVAQNWLSASKIIQEAGKSITSWKNFITALRISYENDIEIFEPELLKEDNELLKSLSKELWGQEISLPEESQEHQIIEYNINNTNLLPQTGTTEAIFL